jgi:PEP-CTERM motif
MISSRFLVAIGIAIGGFMGCAQAANVAYMSGAGEPWGSSSNLNAMDSAFGSGQWDRVNFGAALTGYNFLYVDGGDYQGTSFYSWLDSNRAGLESFVTGGGRLFLNAATNGAAGTESMVFGATTREGGNGYSSMGSAVNAADPLFTGAGTSWSGTYFAHNEIGLADGFTSFITGDHGQTIVAGGSFGSGYVMVGGQTNTDWHSAVAGSNPFQLRVNELNYAANIQVSAVPEPETYAMMLAGLGLMGAVARRRKTQQA